MSRRFNGVRRFGWVAAVVAVVYVLNFGFFPRYFHITWDEEVELHDGRIVMMHVERKFERLGLRMERWDGVHRGTSFSFDAGPPIGRVSQELDQGELFLLDRDGDVWYIGMWGKSGSPIRNVSDDPLAVHVYTLADKDKATRLASNRVIPASFKRENILPVTPDSQGMKHLNGTVVTLGRKAAHWGAHPRAARDPFPKVRRYDYGKGEQQ